MEGCLREGWLECLFCHLHKAKKFLGETENIVCILAFQNTTQLYRVQQIARDLYMSATKLHQKHNCRFLVLSGRKVEDGRKENIIQAM